MEESNGAMDMVEEGQNQPKISPKRIKGEDGISALPDCLLIEIISRLPSTKEAIRTGTLSKRWKHLWTLVHTLIFIHSSYPIIRCPKNPKSNSDFISFVDKTLTQCRQLKLKTFQVCTNYHFQVTHYNIRFKSQFNNWIHYAISCNVEKLHLDFCPGFDGLGAEFVLDQFIFISSCFTDLRLAGCIMDPTGAITWKNLRNLCISRVELDEDLIENILSGSPLLETLELKDCFGYRCVDITSKSVKNLVFSGYNDEYEEFAEFIEINAPNIVSLTIEGCMWLRKLVLLNVSSVVEANLDYFKLGYYETTRKVAEEEMLIGLILKLRHVKELKIGAYCSTVLSRLEAKGFDFPSNMKFPDDTVDLIDSDSTESDDL